MARNREGGWSISLFCIGIAVLGGALTKDPVRRGNVAIDIISGRNCCFVFTSKLCVRMEILSRDSAQEFGEAKR